MILFNTIFILLMKYMRKGDCIMNTIFLSLIITNNYDKYEIVYCNSIILFISWMFFKIKS